MPFKVKKTHYFPHTAHYCCSSMPRLSETRIFTKLIVLRSEVCSDWPAIHCIVIGRMPQAWDGNLTPLTVLWCRVTAQNNKTHYKQTFVASTGDIITDYNDLYCLFKIVNITHVCICDRRIKKLVIYTIGNPLKIGNLFTKYFNLKYIFNYV